MTTPAASCLAVRHLRHNTTAKKQWDRAWNRHKCRPIRWTWLIFTANLPTFLCHNAPGFAVDLCPDMMDMCARRAPFVASATLLVKYDISSLPPPLSVQNLGKVCTTATPMMRSLELRDLSQPPYSLFPDPPNHSASPDIGPPSRITPLTPSSFELSPGDI